MGGAGQQQGQGQGQAHPPTRTQTRGGVQVPTHRSCVSGFTDQSKNWLSTEELHFLLRGINDTAEFKKIKRLQEISASFESAQT